MFIKKNPYKDTREIIKTVDITHEKERKYHFQNIPKKKNAFKNK